MHSVIFKLTAMTSVVLVGFAVAYQAQLSLSDKEGAFDAKKVFGDFDNDHETKTPQVELGNEATAESLAGDLAQSEPDYKDFARGLDFASDASEPLEEFQPSAEPTRHTAAATKNSEPAPWDDDLPATRLSERESQSFSDSKPAPRPKRDTGVVPVQFEEEADDSFLDEFDDKPSAKTPDPIDRSVDDDSHPLLTGNQEPATTPEAEPTQTEPDFFLTEDQPVADSSKENKRFTRSSDEPGDSTNSAQPQADMLDFDNEFGPSIDANSVDANVEPQGQSTDPEVVEPDFAFDEPEIDKSKTKTVPVKTVPLTTDSGSPKTDAKNNPSDTDSFDPFEPETNSDQKLTAPALSQDEPAAAPADDVSTEPLFPEFGTSDEKRGGADQPELKKTSPADLFGDTPLPEPATTNETVPVPLEEPAKKPAQLPSGFTPVQPKPIEFNPQPANPQPAEPGLGQPGTGAPIIGVPSASDSRSNEEPTRLTEEAKSSAQTLIQPPQMESVQKSARLTIQKKAPSNAVLGKPMVYDIVVKNVGDQGARQVRVEDRIPAGTRLIGTIPGAKKKDDVLFWDIDSIQPGEEQTISVKIIPTTVGQVGSVATVNFVSEIVADTEITAPKLDLQVVVAENVRTGEKVKLAFHVSNNGNAPAKNVVLRQNLPAQLVHVSGRSIQYEIGELPAGQSKNVDLVLTAASPGAGVSQTFLTADGDIKIDKQSPVSVVGQSLVITRSGPKNRYLGREGAYTNSVTNDSDVDLQQITVTEKIPVGMRFVEASENGQFDASTNSVTWQFPALAARETKVVRVKLLAQALGQQASTVEANAQGGQRATIQAKTDVSGFSLVDVDVPAIDGPVEVGEPFAVRVVAQNRGTAAATGVKVRVTIPAETEFVSAKSGVKFTRVGNRILFEPVSILESQDRMEFQIILKGSAAGTSRLKVEIEADQAKQPFWEEEPLVILPRTE